MVAKMKLIYPPTITNIGRTIMCIFISQDMGWDVGRNMERESQSKNKETSAI